MNKTTANTEVDTVVEMVIVADITLEDTLHHTHTVLIMMIITGLVEDTLMMINTEADMEAITVAIMVA